MFRFPVTLATLPDSHGTKAESRTWGTRGVGVRISMDGKGRFLDNIFVERLWRSLKYEEVLPRRMAR
jgi:hypothetical protein